MLTANLKASRDSRNVPTHSKHFTFCIPSILWYFCSRDSLSKRFFPPKMAHTKSFILSLLDSYYVIHHIVPSGGFIQAERRRNTNAHFSHLQHQFTREVSWTIGSLHDMKYGWKGRSVGDVQNISAIWTRWTEWESIKFSAFELLQARTNSRGVTRSEGWHWWRC